MLPLEADSHWSFCDGDLVLGDLASMEAGGRMQPPPCCSGDDTRFAVFTIGVKLEKLRRRRTSTSNDARLHDSFTNYKNKFLLQ